MDGWMDGWTRGQEVTAVLVHHDCPVWLSDSAPAAAAVNSSAGRFRSPVGRVRVAISAKSCN